MARRRRRPPKKRSCTGKDKLTKEAARKRARALERKQGSLMKYYECPHKCRMPGSTAISWHVGHRFFTK